MFSNDRFINLHPPVYGRAELSLHPLDQGFVSFVALQGPQESEHLWLCHFTCQDLSSSICVKSIFISILSTGLCCFELNARVEH